MFGIVTWLEMNGAANGAKPGFQALFNPLSDLMRRNQVVDIHHHVHVNEDLLAQDTSTGDVMAIEDSRYTQSLLVDGFGCNRNVINKSGKVVA